MTEQDYTGDATEKVDHAALLERIGNEVYPSYKNVWYGTQRHNACQAGAAALRREKTLIVECEIDVGFEEPRHSHIFLKSEDVRPYVEALRERIAELEAKLKERENE